MNKVVGRDGCQSKFQTSVAPYAIWNAALKIWEVEEGSIDI
jgi:hypothetical protein